MVRDDACPTRAAAILDRMVNNAQLIQLTGEPMRNVHGQLELASESTA